MEFYRDRKKSMTMILACAGILVILIAVFLYSIGLVDDHVSTKLAAVTGIFSVILIIVIINKLFSLRDSSPLIIMNQEGIISKTTAVSKAAGLILWKDIKDVEVGKVGGDTLVTFTVTNADHYLPLIKKKLSGMMTNGLADPEGNLPISLTASELTIDAEELYNTIISFKKEVG